VPVNNLSIGHDVSVTIFDATTQQIVAFPARTGFSAEPITKTINSEPLNGPPQFAEAPNGWKGTLDFDRTDPSIDIYFANYEAQYYNGGNPLSGTITQTIQEKGVNGAPGIVTQFVFTGVAMKLSQAGQWKAAEKVPQKIDWMASTRTRVL
jgi:hypothetical protein